MTKTLSTRLRYEASRLPHKFSMNDELFQLLTEAADELDRRETLTTRLMDAAEIADKTAHENFSALFREAARTIDDMQYQQRKAYLDGRKSAFLQVLGRPEP